MWFAVLRRERVAVEVGYHCGDCRRGEVSQMEGLREKRAKRVGWHLRDDIRRCFRCILLSHTAWPKSADEARAWMGRKYELRGEEHWLGVVEGRAMRESPSLECMYWGIGIPYNYPSFSAISYYLLQPLQAICGWLEIDCKCTVHLDLTLIRNSQHAEAQVYSVGHVRQEFSSPNTSNTGRFLSCSKRSTT